MASSDEDLESLRAERDLYRALLDLGAHEDLTPFLDEALGLIATVTGARIGYLAVHPRGRNGTDDAVHIARGVGPGDVERIRGEISSGIVGESLRTGRTVSTASAREDPRFQSLASVQAQRIDAVLCAPIGGERGIGVLYLQGRAQPGPFTARDRALVETFALRIAPFAERLLARDRENSTRDHTTELRARLRVDRIVGRSRAMADTLKQLAVASGVDATVLIEGESGTGKTEFARALHDSSKRAKGPFVEINCAALPETLFEAELFGAEKGAHSTATRRMPGKIAAAQGGTLFLDEVGEIPLAVQPKLLQFLQSHRYYRLGADAATEADVRVVAATNADLLQAVREKRFREDLYYRLHVLSIRVPPLRDRVDDIALLAEHIAALAAKSTGRELPLTYAARAALASAEWPGNVRQLAAAMQRGVAFAIEDRADAIDVRHLFTDAASVAENAPVTWQDGLRRFQRRFLEEALTACDGNVSETARRLGLARSHLHELLRSHGLGRARGG